MFHTLEKLTGAIAPKLPNPIFQFFVALAVAICVVLTVVVFFVKAVVLFVWNVIKIPYYLVKLVKWGFTVLPLVALVPKYIFG